VVAPWRYDIYCAFSNKVEDIRDLFVKSDECLGEILHKNDLVKKKKKERNRNHSFVSFVSRELKLNMPYVGL